MKNSSELHDEPDVEILSEVILVLDLVILI